MTRSTKAVLLASSTLVIGTSLCMLVLFAGRVFATTFPAYLSARTEDQPTGETLTRGVRLEELILASCRQIDPAAPPDAWGAAKIVTNSPDYWAKGIVGVILPDRQGKPLGAIARRVRLPGQATVLLLDSSLQADGRPLLLEPDAVGEPALRFRLTSQMAVWANRNDIAFDQLLWAEADPATSSYSLTVALVEHTLPTAERPQHGLVVRVANVGSMPLFHTQAAALVRARDGRLIDILSSEAQVRYPLGKRIWAGADLELPLTSLSRSGRCVGEPDPNGYQIELFVEAVTASGEPISNFRTFAEVEHLSSSSSP